MICTPSLDARDRRIRFLVAAAALASAVLVSIVGDAHATAGPEAPVVPPAPAGATEPGFFTEARARVQALTRERAVARAATANESAYDQRYASLDLDIAPREPGMEALERRHLVALEFQRRRHQLIDRIARG